MRPLLVKRERRGPAINHPCVDNGGGSILPQ